MYFHAASVVIIKWVMLKWNRNEKRRSLTSGIWTQINKYHLWVILLDEGWKWRFVFPLQQNLISIQRQKSEVMAATASFYDSFLDVIEFRVTVSTLTHQTHCTQTRNLSCSCFGFYLMQKILFDMKDNTFILNITCSCITVLPPPAVTFACVFEAPAPWTHSLLHTNM